MPLMWLVVDETAGESPPDPCTAPASAACFFFIQGGVPRAAAPNLQRKATECHHAETPQLLHCDQLDGRRTHGIFPSMPVSFFTRVGLLEDFVESGELALTAAAATAAAAPKSPIVFERRFAAGLSSSLAIFSFGRATDAVRPPANLGGSTLPPICFSSALSRSFTDMMDAEGSASCHEGFVLAEPSLKR